MYMAYTQNPQIPKVRMDAVKLVKSGWSTRQVARHLGFAQGTIVKWTQRAPQNSPWARVIPTKSSRPHFHPQQLSPEIVRAILDYRLKYRRCAQVLHHLLKQNGIEVSLVSVKRTLKRNGLTHPSKWKKWHIYPPRPIAEKPGLLVQLDTIHDGEPVNRLYIYTLLDVCSRWAFAVPSLSINTHNSLGFVDKFRNISPFAIKTLQSDHGSEFSKWFTKRICERGLAHRHSRIRQPNDNAHLERFNRTLQDECLRRIPRSLGSWQKEIPEYLIWYNQKRPHMGLEMKSPIDILKGHQVIPRS